MACGFCCLVVVSVMVLRRLMTVTCMDRVFQDPKSLRSQFGTDDIHIVGLAAKSARAAHQLLCHLYRPEELFPDPQHRLV